MALEGYLAILSHAINSNGNVSKSDWDLFSRIWKVKTVKYKEKLSLQGDVEHNVYFVVDGILRVHHIDSQGRDTTVVFTYKGDFGGVLDSFLLKSPSRYVYESLSKATVLVCQRSAFTAAMARSETLAKHMDKYYHQALSGMMLRVVELQSMSAQEKFSSLLRRSPHILNLIPHKYLANYIGIHPTNFSKLVNTIKIT